MGWRERFPDEGTCIRCLQIKDTTDLDRLFWCRDCKEKARERAKKRGWVVGAVAGVLLTGYIWIVIQPSDLILGGWIATVVAGAWLISRIGREVSFGVERYRNRRAVDARPPSEASPDSEDDSDSENPFGWRSNRG